MYVFPLISVYWAFIMPSAVGLYWIISSVTSFIQSLVTNKYFSVNHMTAMAEAQRAVTLELAEANVRPLPAAAQKGNCGKAGGRAPAGKAGKGRRQKAGRQEKEGRLGRLWKPSTYMGTKK